MNNDQKMTIEDLARLIEKRFQEQDSKINNLTEKMGNLSGAIITVSDNLDTLAIITKNGFDAQEERFLTRREFSDFILKLKLG